MESAGQMGGYDVSAAPEDDGADDLMLSGAGSITDGGKQAVNVRPIDAHGHQQIHLQLKGCHHHSLLSLCKHCSFDKSCFIMLLLDAIPARRQGASADELTPILPLYGLARIKQEPIKRGRGISSGLYRQGRAL